MLGRYLPGPIIGHGATARVYRARDTRLGHDVALKEILLQHGRPGRVHAEVRAAARLSHPNLVRLNDWGQDDTAVYLSCELVDGQSLAEIFSSRRTPSAARMVAVVADVLDGLAHAHGRGVIHRDVKPANVLVGTDGRARLTDFGIARLADEARHTRTGVALGTMAYMAPEQATGRAADGSADVYAACLVLYEGLTGANPIATGNPAETARRAARGHVPELGELRPDLPKSLTRAIMQGLQVQPNDRPTAARLADTLRLHGCSRAARQQKRTPPRVLRGERLVPVVIVIGAPLAMAVGLGCLVALAVGLLRTLMARLLTLCASLGAVGVLGLGPTVRHPLMACAALAGAALAAGAIRHVRGRVRARVAAGWLVAFGLGPALILPVPIASVMAISTAALCLVGIGVARSRRGRSSVFGTLRVVR